MRIIFIFIFISSFSNAEANVSRYTEKEIQSIYESALYYFKSGKYTKSIDALVSIGYHQNVKGSMHIELLKIIKDNQAYYRVADIERIFSDSEIENKFYKNLCSSFINNDNYKILIACARRVPDFERRVDAHINDAITDAHGKAVLRNNVPRSIQNLVNHYEISGDYSRDLELVRSRIIAEASSGCLKMSNCRVSRRFLINFADELIFQNQ